MSVRADRGRRDCRSQAGKETPTLRLRIARNLSVKLNVGYGRNLLLVAGIPQFVPPSTSVLFEVSLLWCLEREKFGL